MSTRNLALIGLLAVALGILIRVAEIDRKIFWFNEVFTALRLSCEFETRGHFPELLGAVVTTPATLVAYQTPSPADGYLCIVRSLAAKDRMNPPVYYFAARLWTDAVGFSTRNLRLLSVLFGIAVIGASAFLAQELFRDRRAAIVAAALVAVSPIFLRYAQEARSYSLWLLLAILAATMFLRASRSGNARDWWVCLFLLCAALWTHLLTISLLMSFALYLLLRDGLSWTPSARRLALVGGGAMVLISPWLANILAQLLGSRSNLSHLTMVTEPAVLFERFGQNLSHILLSWPDQWGAWTLWALLPLGALIGLAFALLWRQGPRPAFWFLVALILPGLALTLVPDLILGGQRSLRARYVFPMLLALLLALAYLLAMQPATARWRAWLAPMVLALGAASSWQAVRSSTWWGLSAVDLRLLDVVATEPASLIVTDVVYGVVAPLGHRLDDATSFLLLGGAEIPTLPGGFARYLLYQPDQGRLESIRRISTRPPELIFEMTRIDGRPYRLYRFFPRAKP